MSIDVIIPSCLEHTLLRRRVAAMRQFDKTNYEYIVTGFRASASVNRNYGLWRAMKSENDFIIMIDDDIGGFYPGWQEDLVYPLRASPDIYLVSARLFNPDGSEGPMNGVSPGDFSADVIDARPVRMDKDLCFPMIPSAAIAFRKDDVVKYALDFDMDFIGSGFEDTLFCYDLITRISGARIVCHNACALTHYHEMKNQLDENLRRNQGIFFGKVRQRREAARGNK